jgi:hypothetical protein
MRGLHVRQAREVWPQNCNLAYLNTKQERPLGCEKSSTNHIGGACLSLSADTIAHVFRWCGELRMRTNKCSRSDLTSEPRILCRAPAVCVVHHNTGLWELTHALIVLLPSAASTLQ